jgi:hypothetical protein
VPHGGGIARVFDTLGQSIGNAKSPLYLCQHNYTGIRRQPTAVKSELNRFAANRWKTGQNTITIRHGGRELR